MEVFDGNKSFRNDFKRIFLIENVYILLVRFYGMELEIILFVFDVWVIFFIWVVVDVSE